MESDDLLVTLGLSSYGSDLQENGVKKLESMQKMELYDSRMDGFCVFNPYLGIYNEF